MTHPNIPGTLFRLDASIRHQGSVTRSVADTIESTIADELGGPTVTRRDVAADTVDGSLWATATSAQGVDPADHSSLQAVAVGIATRLADEVVDADTLLFAVPMYNFGVSQHFKTWYDLVATDPRLKSGNSAVAGRSGFLVTARGGGYGPGTPRDGWDHATGWMCRVLQDVWGLDLQVIETELTLAEVNPQMAELREMAREQLAASHDKARQAARSVSRSALATT